MLKNNKIITLSIFMIMFSTSLIDMVWAANQEQKDMPADAQTDNKSAAKAGAEANNSNDSDDIGFSGSYLSSQFARSNGDIVSAIASLEDVYKKSPQNTEIANQLMGLYLLNGQIDNAMDIASNSSKANAKEPISALMLSLRAIKNNDYESATKILDVVSEEDGGQLWLPLISAWLDAEQHKLLKPLMIEELSAEVGRAAPVVYYHLALINAKAGFIKQAAEDFKQSIEDVGHPPIRVMQMLLQFYDNNNSPAALKPLVKAYREANKKPLKTKAAIIDNVKDGAAEVMLTMGSIMLSADVVQDATLYLQLTLYLKPDMEIAKVALAQAYSELQQYVIANQLLMQIPETSPLYSSAQLYTAINLGRLKKTDEAISILDALIAKSPDEIEAYMAKGDLLRANDKYPEAIDVYKIVLKTLKEERPRHWPIFFAMAICYDKEGNWQEAEKNLKRSLELSPNQPDVLNYLGYSFIMRGENLTKAKDLIEKAIKKRPSDPQIMDSMGWVLYLLKDYKQAVIYLERAVSLLPADVTVNEHLGDVYWRLGRKTEARFQWDRSLTYSKDDNVSQEIKKKLKDGLPEEVLTKSEDKKEKTIPLSQL